MTIIISKDGKNATKVPESAIPKEEYLQKYIYNNPDSIPLYDIKQDIRLLVVSREFPVGKESIDVLALDNDGEIYLVETKLYKNPDKRLVVAQVLDYGASLWKNVGFEDFIATLEEKASKTFGMSLNQKVSEAFGILDDEVLDIREKLRNNFNRGNFKFVVLMDELHDGLKDLILFINQNSKFDIFAVEMEYYKYQDYEIMIPKLFGAEVKKDPPIPPERGQWNKEKFFTHARENLTDEQYKAVEALYNFSKEKANDITWGTGGQRGSFSVKFSKISSSKSLYTVSSNGILSLNFGWLHDTSDAEKYRDAFRNKLSRIKAITIPPDYQEKYVWVAVDKWSPAVNDFIEIVQELISEDFSL